MKEFRAWLGIAFAKNTNIFYDYLFSVQCKHMIESNQISLMKILLPEKI